MGSASRSSVGSPGRPGGFAAAVEAPGPEVPAPGAGPSIPVGTAPDAATYDPVDGSVYVTTSEGNNVGVIQGSSVVGTVNVGLDPRSPVTDALSGDVYVVNEDSQNVSVVRGSTLVGTIRVGSYPCGATYDSATGDIYIANSNSRNVSVLDGLRAVASVPIEGSPYAPPEYYGGAYDPADGYVDLPNPNSASVSVISGTSLLGTVPVGSFPSSATYDNADGYVYVTNAGSGNVTALHGTSIVGSVNVGSDPFASTFDNADGDVYVVRPSANAVSVINGTTVVGSIGVGVYPSSLMYDSGNGYVYTSNPGLFGGSNTVNVLDGVSAVGLVGVGTGPGPAAYDRQDGVVYVPDLGSGTVSVITNLYPDDLRRDGADGGDAVDRGRRRTQPHIPDEFGFVRGAERNVSVRPGSGPRLDDIELHRVDHGVRNDGLRCRSVDPVHLSGDLRPNGSPDRDPVGRQRHGIAGILLRGGRPRLPDAERVLSGTSAVTVGTTYTSPGGSIAIDGHGVAETLVFTEIPYEVTFEENGLSGGTDWSVTFDGRTESASASPAPLPGSCPSGVCADRLSSVTFLRIVSGSYEFTVDSVPGHAATPQSGWIAVNGSSATEAIGFSALPATVLGLPPMQGYAVLGGITAILVIAVVLVVFPGKPGDPEAFEPAPPAPEPETHPPPVNFWPDRH